MGSDRPSRRVSHPILRLEVVASDGTRVASHRVFCRLRHESVPIGVCCACYHCDAIRGAPSPSVECSVPVDPDERGPDRSGERTEVGGVLTGEAVVVNQSATLREVFQLLQNGARHSVAVVDGDQLLVGVVHELAFLRPAAPAGDADLTRAMSSAMAVHESMPVRAALRFLAAAHMREATVVTDTGKPLGVFRDVDGLRWIARARVGGDSPADEAGE